MQAPNGEILATPQRETPDHIKHDAGQPHFAFGADAKGTWGVRDSTGRTFEIWTPHHSRLEVDAPGAIEVEIRTEDIEDVELKPQKRQRFQKVTEFATDNP